MRWLLWRVFMAVVVASLPLAHAGTLLPILQAPSCKAYRYPVDISTASGKKRSGPTGGLFCTSQDFVGPLLQRSPAASALATALKGKVIKNATLSSYLYSDADFASLLCAQSFSREATILVLAQQTGDGAGRVSRETAMALDSCSVTPRYMYFGCDVFDEENPDSPSEPCPRGRVNILHLKSAQFELTDGTAVILLGSGNFNRSLYANLEDWVLFTGNLGERFQVVSACAANTVRSLSGVNASAATLKDQIEACLSSWPASAPTPGYHLEIAPLQGETFRRRLLEALGAAEAIDIAAQAFEDPELVGALLANKGARLRVIADDDWYWALKAKAPMHTANYDKLRWVEQLPPSAVRYIQTNHNRHGGVGNTLHTRMVAVTQAGVRTIFTGSAHFRPGSLTGNLEHLLTITEPAVTAKYVNFLDDLWNRALPWQEMPLIDAPIVVP